MTKKKLLIIEPHSDDSIIAAGGFLEKYGDNYEIYFSLVCASDLDLYHGFVSRDDRIKEYQSYVSHFGGTFVKTEFNEYILPLDLESKLDLMPRAILVKLIELTIMNIKPDLIMCMGPSFHHDHTLVYESIIAATRPTFLWTPPNVYIMENPTYVHDAYSDRKFNPNLFIELNEEQIDKKNKLFERLFPSQIRTEGNYLSSKGIKKWAQYRGIEARCDFAEAFSIYFSKI